MSDKNITSEIQEAKPFKLARSSYSFIPSGGSSNPWTSTTSVDKFDFATKAQKDETEKFRITIDACRFFYERDPIASTVINRIVDIGITDLIVGRKSLTANEYKLITGIKDMLIDFAEAMALEYLISGLVIPEIQYEVAEKEELNLLGIKKFNSLTLPTMMWLRDPMTIKIKSLMLDDTNYYVEIPPDLIAFILNKGQYPDGTKDLELYNRLLEFYPDFVRDIMSGKKEVQIKNENIFRRKVKTGTPYPTPYLSAAIESMKHKRNIRRMDYALAARVIGAIQLFSLGTDKFPVTEDQQDQIDAIKNQMYYRTNTTDIEKVFQLFANHTLEIKWIIPPLDALVNDKKYAEINQDIVYALGFPRILTTGETERTGTSSPEYAILAPMKTIEKIRREILRVLNRIVRDTLEQNNLRGSTEVRFAPINMSVFSEFLTGLSKLYDTGNLSREEFAKLFGYDIEEEFSKRSDEKKLLTKYGIDEFEQQPFTPPASGSNPKDNKTDGEDTKKDKKDDEEAEK